ncbi:MAG: ATP/GTP-binding protein [Thaumarchaeota archaeon]|nr:ATP/GTP-binding protein [Nitrososphaerota archaeon]
MYAIFLTGTAGSGKSLLTSILAPWYAGKGSAVITVNLDPGVVSLPYTPDVDIRDYIDINELMERYQLGPNGALILSADMIATKLPEIQEQIDSINPDYAIIDTPGQLELFAYRESGAYIVKNISADAKMVIFLFDASLVSTPSNLVSVALLAASIRLRLGVSQVAVLSKKDLVGDAWKKIMRWSSNRAYLEDELSKEADSETYLLSKRIVADLAKTGLTFELIPVSAVTSEGMVELSGSISRILRGGEEVED